MAGRRIQGKEGFSLIEVLVSLAILSVGLLALALFQVTAIQGNAIASKWTTATQLSQDRLERFRHVQWSTIVSSNAAGFNTGTMQPVYANLPAAQGDSTVSRGTTYYRVWNVAVNSATLKTITVWTCWQDDMARWHNVMLVTQRVDLGGA